jgi:arginyl-tRNA synthetase
VTRIPQQIAAALRQSIVAAQQAGQLPAFAAPTLKIERPKRADLADYACAVALQLKTQTGKNPLETAKIIAAHMPATPLLQSTEVSPPGFLNFKLSPVWLAQQVQHIVAAGEQVFQASDYAGKTAQVEYVSANPTGPLSVHRIRGGVIGDTLANLLTASGYHVTREYYFNNAGQQMNKLGESVRARYLELLNLPADFPEGGYKGLYIRMIAATIYAFRGDSLRDAAADEFRQLAAAAIIERIRASMRRINIHHDVFFNESSLYEDGSVYETVRILRERGLAYDLDGAVWFKSTELGDEKDRVIIKKTGEPTYRLPDMAYHRNKLDRGFDLVVDIFGADHAATAPQVLLGVKALGYDSGIVRTIIHQMVELAEGGELKRMSTRRGDFVELDELIDDVGPDAVRYFMLAQSPNSAITFDLDIARAQGDENSVYRIQSAHMRCAGILRKAAERGLNDDGEINLALLGEEELAFVRKMLEAPDMIERAVAENAPQGLAFFALDLAGLFHPLYDRVRVISEQAELDPELAKARLHFYRAAKIVFARLLALMGMSAPETMRRRETTTTEEE